ncbi:bifunctional 5,6,7,8-tetrahydromethanopterin hydro-lyase/3-hexulose-6-phosphate synthase [Methermicoccus shengliensis]|uniref:Bifunctional enzyme Fae/Hps n=1 Tax=Methermicoccus shengliensis TaxID=660064 RepID=A0A832RUU1_9EURY|nr:bifunctional 5,6,7,8-tetrahydromethanopterin hydro-lyase/3-hexulose-6-phosphate synthase [Methermicoccus shengliensis]HIH69697.1 bifunctional 5,6,7,8-tetrahydromethanopterin hydro-lyase/3-hexulose-6-phosphate synthase [Methermicoccus shengliensis]
MLLVGEALIGEEPELAHIDLMIGDKDGPVGEAFAAGLSTLSMGHTPLLAVIRPNLLTKPATLIVPKVTVRSMEDAAKVFGPAQSAVALAVADSVQAGIIPRDKVEELVMVVSVFIHPEAKDFDRLYRYNYGATKLAIARAMEGFPSIDKVLEEKDRDVHPIMGYRVLKLFDPPYLQIAIDIPDIAHVERVLREVPHSDHVIFEAGTPLIKRYGLSIIERMRAVRRDAFIMADLKTLDTGNLEARMAADAAADGVVVSGLAPLSTIESAISEAKKTGIYSCIDMLNVKEPAGLLGRLSIKPDIVELHRAIDAEGAESHAWERITEVKEASPTSLIAVAGGIRMDNMQQALDAGADILVVGRAITKSKDIRNTAEMFLSGLKVSEIDQFRIKTDF